MKVPFIDLVKLRDVALPRYTVVPFSFNSEISTPLQFRVYVPEDCVGPDIVGERSWARVGNEESADIIRSMVRMRKYRKLISCVSLLLKTVECQKWT